MQEQPGPGWNLVSSQRYAPDDWSVPEPLETAQHRLARHSGWEIGKHGSGGGAARPESEETSMRVIALALAGILASPAMAADRVVNIAPDVGEVTVETRSGPVTIERIQDPEHEVTGEWARTSRPCPNFCIQPMSPAEGVTTIGELELLAALQTAVRRAECDVLIIGRGGGSLEDLWAFNDEMLARTIADSAIPVVSAVGHEVDFTISDFVADVRAPTPSGAAEIVVPDRRDWLHRVAVLATRLGRIGERSVQDKAQQIDWLARRLVASSPAATLRRQRDALRESGGRLVAAPAVQVRKIDVSRDVSRIELGGRGIGADRTVGQTPGHKVVAEIDHCLRPLGHRQLAFDILRHRRVKLRALRCINFSRRDAGEQPRRLDAHRTDRVDQQGPSQLHLDFRWRGLECIQSGRAHHRAAVRHAGGQHIDIGPIQVRPNPGQRRGARDGRCLGIANQGRQLLASQRLPLSRYL